MPTTTNYGWTLPTPGGDANVWDTLLNTAIEAIDADLKTVEDSIAGGGGGDGTALAAIDQDIRHSVPLEGQEVILVSGASSTFERIGPIARWTIDSTEELGVIDVLLDEIKEGQQIDSFSVYGRVQNNASCVAKLCRYTGESGAFTQIASVSLGTSFASVASGSLAHTVVADSRYFIRFECDGDYGTDPTAYVELSTCKAVTSRP